MCLAFFHWTASEGPVGFWFMKEKLYIDIAGTILTGAGLAPGAKRFILNVVQTFDCYWLTTHCHGDTATVLRYLRPHADDETYAALEKIRPTNWEVFKTEALDPVDPTWIWLDDAPLATEITWLQQYGREASWIKIDTNADPDALAEFSYQFCPLA